MKNILITGGAGFIGTNVCEFLAAKGYQITVVDSLVAGKRERLPETIRFEALDIRKTQRLSEVMRDHDVVIHLAALPRVQFSIEQPTETHDVNVTGTLSVLEAARSAGVQRIVFASSSSVYGDQVALPLSTTQTPQPKSPYALQKLQGEQLMKLWHQLYDIETVSLRFFNIYGPHQDPAGPYALVIGKFLERKAASETLTITGDGTQTRDFTHVQDLSVAILQASVSPRVGNGEILNIGAGQETSINQIADIIGGEKEYVAPRIEPKRTLADISETIELLGWRPTITVAEGIAGLRNNKT